MTKTELHRLVDALPDESLPAAAILLRRAQDPVVAKLDAAPLDDEELTDEDRLAIKESREEPGIAWSEVEAELNAGCPGGWRVEVRPAALKSLRRLGRKDRQRIAAAIGQLPDGDVKRARRAPNASGASEWGSGA